MPFFSSPSDSEIRWRTTRGVTEVSLKMCLGRQECIGGDVGGGERVPPPSRVEKKIAQFSVTKSRIVEVSALRRVVSSKFSICWLSFYGRRFARARRTAARRHGLLPSTARSSTPASAHTPLWLCTWPSWARPCHHLPLHRRHVAFKAPAAACSRFESCAS